MNDSIYFKPCQTFMKKTYLHNGHKLKRFLNELKNTSSPPEITTFLSETVQAAHALESFLSAGFSIFLVILSIVKHAFP